MAVLRSGAKWVSVSLLKLVNRAGEMRFLPPHLSGPLRILLIQIGAANSGKGSRNPICLFAVNSNTALMPKTG